MIQQIVLLTLLSQTINKSIFLMVRRQNATFSLKCHSVLVKRHRNIAGTFYLLLSSF